MTYRFVAEHTLQLAFNTTDSLVSQGYLPNHVGLVSSGLQISMRFYEGVKSENMYRAVFREVVDVTPNYLPLAVRSRVCHNRMSQKLFQYAFMVLFGLIWEQGTWWEWAERVLSKILRIILGVYLTGLVLSWLVLPMFTQLALQLFGLTAGWQVILISETIKYIAVELTRYFTDQVVKQVVPAVRDSASKFNLLAAGGRSENGEPGSELSEVQEPANDRSDRECVSELAS